MSAPEAGVLALQRSAGNRATARLLGMRSGRAPAGALIQRDDRETNPRPSVAESRGSGVALSEHHVVPYETLEAFTDKMKADGKDEKLRELVARFVPKWKDVSIAELLRLNEISKVSDRKNPYSDPLYPDQEHAMKAHEVMAEERQEELVTTGGGTGWGIERSAQTQRWTELDKALAKYRELNEGIASETHTLGFNYFYWNPGNLFVGPEGAIRTWDPKNKFDSWAQYFMDEDHYKALDLLYKNMRKYVENGTKLGLVSRALTDLSTNYREKTPYRPAEWVLVGDKYKPKRMP